MFTYRVKPLCFLCFIPILFGCATYHRMTSEPFKPVSNVEKDKAVIYVYNKTNFMGSRIAIDLYFDGIKKAQVIPDTYCPYVTEPGLVTISYKDPAPFAKMFENKLNTLYELNAEAGKEYYLKYTQKSYWTGGVKMEEIKPEIARKEIEKCKLAKMHEKS